MTSSSSKLRVLCLHGFRTNRHVIASQIQGLRQALGPKTDFVCLNGPFQASGPIEESIGHVFQDTAPFYEWSAERHYTNEEKAAIQAQEGVAKEVTDVWCVELVRQDESQAYLMQKLEELGEFDVVVGFSQGAIMATIMTMWCLKNKQKCWWKLVLCVCGAAPRGFNVRNLFESREGVKHLVPLPSIHIVGKKDPLYQSSLKLKDMYVEHPTGSPLTRLVFEHDGGHKFPSAERYQKLYADVARAIWQFFDDTRRSLASNL